ncbi:UNVERIFIED_CONTAM: hypothetical protein Cloal_1015 [Acetivibrio alkalicellulosi]
MRKKGVILQSEISEGVEYKYPSFSVYDNLTRFDLRVGDGLTPPRSFLGVATDLSTIYPGGEVWDFKDVTVTGLKGYVTKEEAERMIAEAIEKHIAEYHSGEDREEAIKKHMAKYEKEANESK